MRRLLRLLPAYVAAGSVLLDLGSGPGYSSGELLRLVPADRIERRVLLDPQRIMFARVRKGGAGPSAATIGPPEMIVGDATRLPLKDGSANVILSIGVLCCMKEKAIEPSIEESWRVLSPRGLYLLGVPRWRGAEDEAALSRRGFVRRQGLRAGKSVFQKPIYPPSSIPD